MEVYRADSLSKMIDMKDESIDMIYLDPPFFTQQIQKSKTRNNEKEYLFNDKWSSINDYIYYMEERLNECKRILKRTGSIFLHCDKTASHYLKISMDRIFGVENFRNEIIWTYKRWSNSKKGLLNAHQNIYFYSKTETYKFNSIYTDYSPTTNLDQIIQKRQKNEHGKTVYMRCDKGEIVLDAQKRGVPLSDVWEIPFLNPKAKERVGYPTQKPILLLERIIEISTDENDVVLDPFCGSGTTLVASKLMNRRYIGIDISEDAVNLSLERLKNPIKTFSDVLENGKEKYLNKTDEEMKILNILNANPVQRNKGIDGFLKKSYKESLVSVRIQKENESLEKAIKQLVQSSRIKKCKKMILVKTNLITERILFQEEIEHQDLIIIDSYNLLLDKILME